ncbi:type II secretion system F family protein [Bacteriovorax sp. Seq25_V]|uniref:type II secretion system F family protein n=1 Tax=Bacteriovorax sp. Seq25_V TaxID=1201288 RepID=UPI000389FEE6|nr:type II secretion system F family protein [Bacteriovorax sp. Seq25_V]EQC43218.1 type II secretion system protein F [Bacteriovorax sp. Seq25_V]
MSFFLSLIGFKGLVALIGVILFSFCYKYSVGIFDFIERQTMGTRTYILEKFDLLFIEVQPEKITYALLALSLGSGGIVIIIFGILGKWVMGFILGLVFAFVGFKIPRPIINNLVSKRVKQYEAQMVDGLTLLANGLRAGLSVPQSIGMVVDEMPAPLSQEFNVMLQQNRIGVPLEECFENLAKRVPTQDNDMFVSSVNILRETGGNLAEVFDTIVDVIRERVRLKQKIDTATAQGRFQGMIMAAMPYGILMMYGSSDPEAVGKMFSHPLGIILFVVATVLDFIGTMVIFKIVQIKD